MNFERLSLISSLVVGFNFYFSEWLKTIEIKTLLDTDSYIAIYLKEWPIMSSILVSIFATSALFMIPVNIYLYKRTIIYGIINGFKSVDI